MLSLTVSILFIPHIKALKTKCLKALNILKVVFNTGGGGGADRTMLLHLYRTLVRSKLDCRSIIYGRILNNLILFIIKALDSVLGLSGHHRFQASMLKLIGHLFTIEELNLPCSILQNCARILQI